MKRKFALCAALLLLLAPAMVFAGNGDDSARIKELENKVTELEKRLEELQSRGQSRAELEEIRRQLAILAEEMEKMRSGEEVAPLEESRRRSLGLGPSASTIYTKKQGVSFAGYGEMLYENFPSLNDAGQAADENDKFDFVRAIVYLGYRFNDRFLFNSEIEFEHGSTEQGGSVSVEFAHVDFLMNDTTTIRGGMVLIPMGFLNEFHEPTVFLGAKRTETESFILPSTWRENGAGIVGRSGMFDYRAYVVNGFNASGFDAEEGLREGKQDGAEANIGTPSFVGRVDATPAAGLLVGGSLYAGNSNAFDAPEPVDFKVRTTITEAHAEYKGGPLQFRALFAHASLNHVADLNRLLAKTAEESVGESLNGGYLQAGYNLLAGSSTAENSSLTPYIRFEKINTQSSVPSGFEKDPAQDRTIWTFGAEYHPIFNVVIKADYQQISNQAGTGLNQFNIGMGYSF
jgi:uncharacterized coiled-coil protein SlyX